MVNKILTIWTYARINKRLKMSVRLNDKRRSLDDPLKGLLLELQADATTQDLHTSAKKAGRYEGVWSQLKVKKRVRSLLTVSST